MSAVPSFTPFRPRFCARTYNENQLPIPYSIDDDVAFDPAHRHPT
jgi:hypothetical protein